MSNEELAIREHFAALVEEPVTPEMVEYDPSANVVALRAETAPTSIQHDPYSGVAALPFDEKAQNVLAKYQHVPDDWIDIKPNGQIYLSHVRLRAIYNEAFGYGGWGMVPVGALKVERTPCQSRYPNKPDYEHVTVYREFRLYVQGRFVRQMMGAGDYYTNNAEANYSDAVEAAESYALNRSGKPFGIASQCWDKAYGERWKAKYAYRDGDNKWKKRLDAAGPQGHPSIKEPPVTRADDAATPPAPAPTAASKHSRATIVIKSVKPTSKGKEEWRSPDGVRLAMFVDADGTTWKFQGDAIGAAKGSLATGTAIEVEYVMEQGKYRLVLDAHRTGGEPADSE